MLRICCPSVDHARMGLAINNSINVNRAVFSARTADRALAASTERLATGNRITSSSMDAAGSAMSARMNADIGSMEIAARNINDAISLLQSYEANADSILSMIHKLKSISVAAASGTLSESDNVALVAEYGQLIDEIHNITQRTHWNGMNLFDGSAGTNGVIQIGTGNSTINLDLGTTYNYLNNTLSRSGVGSVNVLPQRLTIADSTDLRAGDVLTFTLYKFPASSEFPQLYSYRLSQADINTINSVATSAIDGDPIFISNLGIETGFSISVTGSNNSGAVDISLSHPTINGTFLALDESSGIQHGSRLAPHLSRGDLTPMMVTFPYAPHGAQYALEAVDSALASFTSKLAKIGAYINRLESSANTIKESQLNLKASNSRITDIDYAKETLTLTKSQILKEASMSMIKAGHDYKSLVLNLIA